MADNPITGMIRQLRRASLLREGAGLPDGELLELYVAHGDESAFEALLRRHGPMVLGVCRRVLRNEADAEDAFQATFLVFVRKAPSLRSRGLVGNWLYGVAHNVARKAKAMSRTRRDREWEAGTAPRPEAREEAWREVRGLLDAELSTLPERYRAAIVLCDLEGKTLREAAGDLGWPQGTLATRLRRGRALLARRLSGRGLTLSAGVVATGVCSELASAGVPASLLSSTVKAAGGLAAGQAVASGLVPERVAALTEGVLQAMFMNQVKLSVLVGLLLAALVGLGLGAYLPARPTQSAGPAKAESKPDEPPPAGKAPAGDAGRIQGTWKVVAMESEGEKAPAEVLKKLRWIIKGMNLSATDEGEKPKVKATIKLDAGKTPKQIDLTVLEGPYKGKTIAGIYKLEEGRLTICQRDPKVAEKGRPTEFKTEKDTGLGMITLERIDPPAGARDDPAPPAKPDKAAPDKPSKDRARKEDETKEQLREARTKLLLLQAELATHKLEALILRQQLAAAGALAGVLRKVDVEKSTVAITYRQTHLPMENIPLATDVKFSLDGKACSIDDLKPGMGVTLDVRNTDDKTFVSALKARSPKKGAR